MGIFVDTAPPTEEREGFLRIGFESDDPKDLGTSFWISSQDQRELELASDILRQYTTWLQHRDMFREDFYEQG